MRVAIILHTVSLMKKWLISTNFIQIQYNFLFDIFYSSFISQQQMFPVIYVLMKRPTEEAYTHLIQYINTELIDIQPASIMTDYEVAMRNALRLAYPNANMNGCWFYHCQAVKQHGSQIAGFMAVARKNTKSAQIYYQLLCLPLLPANEIITVFMDIKNEAKEQFGSLFDPFFHYYEKQWQCNT